MTKMKLLFESWRRFVNEEGSNELPDNVGILIDTDNSPSEISISYIDTHTGGASNEPKGEIRFGPVGQEQSEWFGPCMSAWVVTSAHASPGWATLLYDVAVEWASMRGEGVGLAPDRATSDDESLRAWNEFLTRKDVQALQLDDISNEMTSDENDNCAQNSAAASANSQGIEWHQSPLSKVYKKENPSTIKMLQAAGKLVVQENV